MWTRQAFATSLSASPRPSFGELSASALAALEIQLRAREMGLDPALERHLPAPGLLPGQKLLRQGPRPFDQVQIGDRIDGAELRKTMLGCPQELPGAPELEILLRKLLSVLDPLEDPEALPCDLPHFSPDQEHASA